MKEKTVCRPCESVELHGMEEASNCAEWKTRRTAWNGRRAELHETEEVLNCAERK